LKAYNKKLLLLIIDAVLINLAVYIALIFRFDGKIPMQYIQIFENSFIYMTLIEVIIYYFIGLYKSL